MSKKNIIGAVAVLVVVVALGIWIGSWLVSRSPSGNSTGPSAYTAVYLTTGDIYFGKFSRFPRAHMKDAWFLQRTTGEDNQPQFGIVPFGNAFWGPVNEISFNADQILFWARLRNDSQVVTYLENPSALQQGGGALPAGGQAPANNPDGSPGAAPTR